MGQEKREIKALSSEEIAGYLEGQGMGFAKAAELNHYPGPKHVLELAEQLQLGKQQLQRTKEVYDKMHKQAVSMGRQIVEKERALDHLFANQKINETTLKGMVVEIGMLQGELRAVHLRAHLEMKEILSRHQIERYDELRGYKGDGGHGHEHHHSGHH
jgi:hypothetical protein